jgi:hypothetical protein
MYLGIRFRSGLAGTRTHAISRVVAKMRLCGRATNGESLRIGPITGRNVTDRTLVLRFRGRRIRHPNAKTSGEDSKGKDNRAEKPPGKLNIFWRLN